MLKKCLLLFSSFLFFTFSNCGSDEMPTDMTVDTGKLTLRSILREDFRIDDRYTCNGANESPPYSWSDSYSTTQSYVLIISNGKSGTDRQIYWLLSDISASVTSFSIGETPAGAVVGSNSFGGNTYTGPCPVAEAGKQDFIAQLFALDKTLGLSATANEQALLTAMEGAILAESTVQTYFSAFSINSNNFSIGEKIPVVHTCDGSHTNPHLNWEKGVPAATAYALHFFDDNALGYVHWLLSDITTTTIAEGISPAGAVKGANNRGINNYFGPCPQGASHTYYFRLYALDEPLGLAEGFSILDFKSALEGHVLDQTDFYGVYE